MATPDMRLYAEAHLAELGVTVEEFGRDEDAALARVGQYDAREMMRRGLRPLLPAQVRVRQKLEAEWEAVGTPVVRQAMSRRDAVVRTKDQQWGLLA